MIDISVAYILVAIIFLMGVWLWVYKHYFDVMHQELLKLVCDMETETKFYDEPHYDGIYNEEILKSDIESDGGKRYRRLQKQYQKYGFDDSVTWSMDYTLAAWLAPRLERFIEIASEVTVMEDSYRKDLEEMLEGFKLLADKDTDVYGTDDEKKVDKAFELLAKHYGGLWW